MLGILIKKTDQAARKAFRLPTDDAGAAGAGPSAPALFLVGLGIGIVGLSATHPLDGPLPAALTLLVAGVAVWRGLHAGRGLAPLLLGMAAAWIALAVQPAPPPLPEGFTGGARVPIQGVVVDREERSGSVRLLLERVVAVAGGWQAPGLVQVTIYRQPVTARPGDRVAFKARLRPLGGYNNPGGFDYAAWLHGRGIVASGYGSEPVHPLATEPGWRWNRLRQDISDWITATLPEGERGVAEALLVGRRGRLDSGLRDAFQVSGTLHLMAISGLHLGLVAGWIFLTWRLLLLSIQPLARRWDMKRPAALLTLPFLFGHAALAGWSISTQRATVMVGLLMLAMVSGRARAPWRALCWAAIVLLLWRPSELFAAGFQLSFVAVLGILLWNERFSRRAIPLHKGWQLLWVTLVAALVTAPVAAHHFHVLSPYGPLANLVAVPWVSLVAVPLGLLALPARALHPPLGDALLRLFGQSLELFGQWVTWIAGLPGAWMRTPGPSATGMTLAAGLALLVWMLWRWRRWRLLSGLLIPVVLLWPRSGPPEGGVWIAALDVGQAQSVVLRTADGAWSVVDAGGAVTPHFNIGEGVISPFLWHYGVTRLRRLVISHPQRDHMAGAARLLRNFAVGSLWLGDFSGRERDDGPYRRLLALAAQRGVAVRRFSAAEQVRDGATTWRILPRLPTAVSGSVNDRSLVLEVGHGAQRFLFPGDLEATGEGWLLERGALQPVTALLAPHHGSRSSSSPPFVAALRPGHVLFSVGNNSYGHPHPEIVERWRRGGARIWRTDRHGAVMLHGDGAALTVTTRGGSPEP